MKKTALFLALVMVLTAIGMPITMAGVSYDPYTGLEALTCTEVYNGSASTTKDDRGFIRNVRDTSHILFKGVDFGKKSPLSVDVYHGTSGGEATNGYIEIRLDDPTSAPVARVKMVASAWDAATPGTGDIITPFTGVHDVYITNTKGVSNIFRAVFMKGGGGSSAAVTYTGDNQFADIAENPYKESIYTLLQLGLLEGFTKDVYEPMLGVSRADFANVMFKILNDGTYEAYDEIYADVKVDNKAFNAISYLNGINVVTMPADKKFNPYNFIKTNDAIVMAIRALGFEEMAKLKGGYPAGYLAVAGEEGLLDGLAIEEYLRRDSMAVLVENILNADYLDLSSIAADGFGYVRKSGILSKTRGILKGEGVVSATSLTSLNAPISSVKAGSVIIEGNLFLTGETPAEALLGYATNFFYTEKGEDRTLICIRPKKNSIITEISTQDALEVISLTESALTILEDGAEKEEIISFEPDTRFIYNKKAIDASLSSILDSGVFKGKIIFIENKNAEDVVIIEQYKSVIVASINSTAQTFKDSAGNSYNLNPNKGSVTVTKGGKASAFNMLTSGSILTMYASKNQTGDKYILVNIEEKTVEGTISETDGDIIIIDGAKYTASPQCTKPLSAGVTAKFNVNSFNEIVTYKDIAVSAVSKIAVLIDYTPAATGTLNDVMEIKVFNKDNTEAILPLAKSATIDGVKCINFNEKLNGKSPFVGLKNVDKNTIIIYSVNEKGEVVVLDTHKPGANTSNDKLERLTTNGTESLQMFAPLSTIMRSYRSAIPFETNPEFFIFDVTDDTDSLYYAASYPGGVELGTAISLDVYTTNAPFAQFCIWQGKGSAGTGGIKNPEIIDKKTTVVTADGEKGTKITTVGAAGGKSYVITEKDILSYPALANIVNVLDKGDLVRFKADSRGNVTGIVVVMFADGADKRMDGAIEVTPTISKTLPYVSNGSSVGRYFYGTVEDKIGDFVNLKYKDASGNVWYEYFKLPKNVAKYDVNGGSPVLKSSISSANVAKGDTISVVVASNNVQQVMLLNH